jgi:hypothetical protein
MTLIMLEQIVVGLFLGLAVSAWVAATRPEKINV